VRIERAIYGQILAASLVVALSEDNELSAQQVLLWLLVTMVVFWLAHVYSDVIAARLERETAHLAVQIRSSLRMEWPVAQAALLPGLALALGWAGLWSTHTAIDLAIVLAVLQLTLWGLGLARARGLGLVGTAWVTTVNAAFGLALVGLKVFVH
jgi:hypothetical protein